MTELRFAAPREPRVALVTGGAHGIGRASAVRLAHEGRDIVVADIDPAGEETAQAVRDMGRQALFVPADVTSEDAVHAAVRDAVEQFGRLDILVCSAGILGLEAPFLEQSAAQVEKVLRINVLGVYYAHQAAIPHMLERGWGRCVTLGSGARHGNPEQVPYSISKGAVHSFVRSLGRAYAAQGVLVNGVEPGRALTRMVVPRFTEEFLASPPVAIGRYSDAEEVAEVIEFLCSERNTYTTGAIWSVKGG